MNKHFGIVNKSKNEEYVVYHGNKIFCENGYLDLSSSEIEDLTEVKGLA